MEIINWMTIRTVVRSQYRIPKSYFFSHPKPRETSLLSIGLKLNSFWKIVI